MINKLYAFCLRFQEKSPECQILKAQESLEARDKDGLIKTSAVDQRICEKCSDKKFLIERPECLKCGSWLIRECAIETGGALEFCYKCYQCNLYFYSPKKLEAFARAQDPQGPKQTPETPPEMEKRRE